MQDQIAKLDFSTMEVQKLFEFEEDHSAAESNFDSIEKKINEFRKRNNEEPSAFEQADLTDGIGEKRLLDADSPLEWIKKQKTLQETSDLLTRTSKTAHSSMRSQTEPSDSDGFSYLSDRENPDWFIPSFWKYICAGLEKHNFNVPETVKYLQSKYRDGKYSKLEESTVHSWLEHGPAGTRISESTLQQVEVSKAADIVRKAERQKYLNKQRQMRWRKKQHDLKLKRKDGNSFEMSTGNESVSAPKTPRAKSLPVSGNVFPAPATVENDWFAPGMWKKITSALCKFEFNVERAVQHLQKRFKDGRFKNLNGFVVGEWLETRQGKVCVSKSVLEKAELRRVEEEIRKAARTRDLNKERQKRWRNQQKTMKENSMI